jgi:hypothetical protein
MRNLKKLLALTVVLALTMGLMVPAFAAKTVADFADSANAKAVLDAKAAAVGGKTVYEDAVNFMIDLNVIEGQSVAGSTNRNLALGSTLTRAEFAVMLYKAFSGGSSIEASGANYIQMESLAPDTAGHWAKGYANWMLSTGISAGIGGGNFGPELTITFNEALLLCMKAIGLDTKIEETRGFTYPGGVQALAWAIENAPRNRPMLGDLFAIEAGLIDRAGAALLFNYTVRQFMVGYTPITGERFLYDGRSNSILGGTNTVAYRTLLSEKFGLDENTFTVLSDGEWFGIDGTKSKGPGIYGITATVNFATARRAGAGGSDYRLGDGVVVQYEIDWDRRGNPVSYDYYYLTDELAEELGIDMYSVGKSFDVVYKVPVEIGKARADIVEKVYGSVTWLSDSASFDGGTGDLLSDTIADKAGKSVDFTDDTRIFFNYAEVKGTVASFSDANCAVCAGVGTLTVVTAGTPLGTTAGQVIPCGTMVAATASVLTAGCAAVVSPAKPVGIIRTPIAAQTEIQQLQALLGANLSNTKFGYQATMFPGAAAGNKQVTEVKHLGRLEKALGDVNIRVIYDDKNVTAIFFEVYAFDIFENENFDKEFITEKKTPVINIAALTAAAAPVNLAINTQKVKDIKGYEDFSFKNKDRFLWFPIINLNTDLTLKFGVREIEEEVKGKVDLFNTGDSAARIDGILYPESAVRKANLNPAMASALVSLETNYIFYTFNGRVLEIEIDKGMPNYAVVLGFKAAGEDSFGRPQPGEILLLRADGTSFNHKASRSYDEGDCQVCVECKKPAGTVGKLACTSIIPVGQGLKDELVIFSYNRDDEIVLRAPAMAGSAAPRTALNDATMGKRVNSSVVAPLNFGSLNANNRPDAPYLPTANTDARLNADTVFFFFMPKSRTNPEGEWRAFNMDDVPTIAGGGHATLPGVSNQTIDTTWAFRDDMGKVANVVNAIAVMGHNWNQGLSSVTANPHRTVRVPVVSSDRQWAISTGILEHRISDGIAQTGVVALRNGNSQTTLWVDGANLLPSNPAWIFSDHDSNWVAAESRIPGQVPMWSGGAITATTVPTLGGAAVNNTLAFAPGVTRTPSLASPTSGRGVNTGSDQTAATGFSEYFTINVTTRGAVFEYTLEDNMLDFAMPIGANLVNPSNNLHVISAAKGSGLVNMGMFDKIENGNVIGKQDGLYFSYDAGGPRFEVGGRDLPVANAQFVRVPASGAITNLTLDQAQVVANVNEEYRVFWAEPTYGGNFTVFFIHRSVVNAELQTANVSNKGYFACPDCDPVANPTTDVVWWCTDATHTTPMPGAAVRFPNP